MIFTAGRAPSAALRLPPGGALAPPCAGFESPPAGFLRRGCAA